MDIKRKVPEGFVTLKELAAYFMVGVDYMRTLCRKEFPKKAPRTKFSPKEVSELIKKYDEKN